MTEIPPESTGPDAGATPAREPLPWESTIGSFFQRLIGTVTLFFGNPKEGFARIALEQPASRPIGYAIVVGWVSIFFGVAWNLLFSSVTTAFLPNQDPHVAGAMRWIYIVLLIVAPLVILIRLFILSGVYHLFLMLFGGTSRGFGGTLRVSCYADTVQLLQVVPFCGSLIAFGWSIVLTILGLAEVHRTSYGRATAAVLVPIVLCCGCIVAIYALGIAALIGQAGS